eukprot:2578151-Rhodomonas_salina.2
MGCCAQSRRYLDVRAVAGCAAGGRAAHGADRRLRRAEEMSVSSIAWPARRQRRPVEKTGTEYHTDIWTQQQRGQNGASYRECVGRGDGAAESRGRERFRGLVAASIMSGAGNFTANTGFDRGILPVLSLYRTLSVEALDTHSPNGSTS